MKMVMLWRVDFYTDGGEPDMLRTTLTMSAVCIAPDGFAAAKKAKGMVNVKALSCVASYLGSINV